MSKTINLGRVTAYADAVAAGYTGTREEFAHDLANAANYAAEAGDAAETATEAAATASTAAETATGAAEEASADAEQAHADAQAILGAKETAVAAAATATSKAGEAANSAQQASASETAAAGSATTASNAATSATASKNAAATSETNAANSAAAAAQTLTNVNQAGATQVAAIQAKGTEVLNSIPADYTELSNDVDGLKSDFNDLDNSIFDTDTVPKAIDISNINGIVSALGMNGTIATSEGNEGLNFTTLANYDSYYVILEQPCEVWFEDSDIVSNYLAVLVGRSFTTKIEREGFILLKSSDAVRYKKSDGNLPTVDNKLSLSAGDVLGFTMTAGTMSKIHGFAEETKRAVSEEFKNEFISKTKPTYSVEIGKIVINQKKARYEVVHCIDASINQNVWRVYRCGLIDGNGNIHYMWDGSDADGVLKLVTDGALESDFVGGYHGDEILTDVKLFVDGNEIDIANTASGDFDKLEIWASSNVYHVDSEDLAFERFKVITFDNTSLTIKNNFIAKNTVSIGIAYLAMLSVERTLINAYYGNNDYKIMGNTDTVTATPNLDHATVNTDYGVLDFRYTGDKTMYDGAVNSYNGTGISNRLKWYFADIHTVSSRPVILNTNDTIRGEYILKIS